MRKYVRELPVSLSDPEKADRAQQLAKVELETQETEGYIEDVRRTAKEEIKAYTDTLTAQRGLCRRLARTVTNGEEMLNVDVEERLSEDSTEIETVRLDLNEVVDRRAATDEDRQLGLDGLVDETLDKVEEDTESAGEHDEDPEEGVDDDVEGMATHETSDLSDDDEAEQDEAKA